MFHRKPFRTIVALLPALVLGVALAQSSEGGTSSADGMAGPAASRTVEITIANDTSGQVFSAPVAVAHGAGYRPFELHHRALPELVPLAEDGRTTDLATVAAVLPSVGDLAIADGPLAPGERVTLELVVDPAHPLVSVFGMLVSSNDAVFVFGSDLSSALPHDGMSGESMSGESMSGDGMSGESMSGDGMSGESMSGDGMSGDAMSGDGMSADAMSGDAMSGDAMSGDAMSGDGMSADTMSGDAMSGNAMSGDAMSGGAMIDLYDGTVRVLDAGSEANTESCADVPGPPCGSAGARHPAMAEGTVELHAGLRGGGDLDPSVYGWTDPVASVSLAFR